MNVLDETVFLTVVERKSGISFNSGKNKATNAFEKLSLTQASATMLCAEYLTVWRPKAEESNNVADC